MAVLYNWIAVSFLTINHYIINILLMINYEYYILILDYIFYYDCNLLMSPEIIFVFWNNSMFFIIYQIYII